MNEPHKKPIEAETDTAPVHGAAPDGKGHTSADAPDQAASAAETAAEQGAEGSAGEKIAALEAEVASLKDQLLRTLAETENIRRRAQREREDTAKYAVSSFAKDLVAVADNLRRAVDAVTPEQREADEALKNLLTGIEATERQLHAA